MTNKILASALRPLAALADAFDAGRLEHEGARDDVPSEIELYQGRGGTRLLTLQHAIDARRAIETGADLKEAFAPLQRIKRAWDANELDDEARKFFGLALEKRNITPPHDVALVSSTGGATLLSLGEVLDAYGAYLEHCHGTGRVAA